MTFLLSEWYHARTPTKSTMLLVSFIWGFSMACSVFSGAKGLRQSYLMWRCTRWWAKYYMVMVWIEWISCFVMSIITWSYLQGRINSRYVRELGCMYMDRVGAADTQQYLALLGHP